MTDCNKLPSPSCEVPAFLCMECMDQINELVMGNSTGY